MFSHHAPILHTPPPGSVDKHANVSHSQHFRDGVVKGPGRGIIIPNHYIISLGSQSLFTYESTYTDILRERSPVFPAAMSFLSFICKFIKCIKWKSRQNDISGEENTIFRNY